MAPLKLPDYLEAPSPPVHTWQSCARTAVHRCRRACVRSTLYPCVKVCKGLIVNPAVKGFGVYSFVAYVHKFVKQLHAALDRKPENEREAFRALTSKCLLENAPQWIQEWARFLRATLNRICMRICARVCKIKCRKSCKTPCARIATANVNAHYDALKRVDNSLYHCLVKCTQACRKACGLLAEKWVLYKIWNNSKSALAGAAAKLRDEWPLDDLIKERKKITDKLNVLNGILTPLPYHKNSPLLLNDAIFDFSYAQKYTELTRNTMKKYYTNSIDVQKVWKFETKHATFMWRSWKSPDGNGNGGTRTSWVVDIYFSY